MNPYRFTEINPYSDLPSICLDCDFHVGIDPYELGTPHWSFRIFYGHWEILPDHRIRWASH